MEQEVIDRLVALARGVADQAAKYPMARLCDSELTEEAKALVELLPALPDPDIIEARALALDSHTAPSDEFRRYMEQGAYDADADVQRYLRAIKLGRKLAMAA